MVEKFFRFGHTDICVRMPEEMKCPVNFEKFAVDAACGHGEAATTDDVSQGNLRIDTRKVERNVFPVAAECESAKLTERVLSGFESLSCLESDGCIQYTIVFADDIASIASDLLDKKIQGACEVVRDNLQIFYIEGNTGERCECRFMRFAGSGKPYGISRQLNSEHFQVWVDRAIANMMEFDTIFTSLFSLEKQVIRTGAMVLHSAYMCWEDSAVLFSAPSETGKSTQANLWEQYRHTYTVNGDRSLLIREKKGWMAYGWPVCGSSEICNNEVHPIRAIVMLRQAKVNRVYRLKGIQALREIMEQITINSWNREFQMKVMDQLELLLKEIPVYCLECDISEDAVACLEDALNKNL